MSPPTLMSSLAARGVRLAVDAADLVVRAPRGVLTDADREELLAHKAELVALLTPPPASTRAGPPPRPPPADPDLVGRALARGGTWTAEECRDIDWDVDIRDLIVEDPRPTGASRPDRSWRKRR